MKTIDLSGIPDKRQDKNTTSLKFKIDLINYFQNIEGSEDFVCTEVGTSLGYTTGVLAQLFGKVYALEYDKNNLAHSQTINQKHNNITYRNIDVYKEDWETKEKVNVSFIDCVHEYIEVGRDIGNSLRRGEGEMYLVFDDYGLIEQVHRAIDDFILRTGNPGQPELVKVTYIGEPKGSDCRPGKVLTDWEGVILKIGF